ncbi:MAG TPA: SAM-dependent chlorinase/fluorinase [Candidatus Binatia bacterium]|nr:SAM-dependent chlorinase/fluorinase [Candidatus Binatia bacterium]
MARGAREVFTANGVVTITTDFGMRDGYVGAVKGVMLSIEPTLRLVDVAHDLPAQDVRHAAVVLRAACPRFPRGTVHLAVIDPGVGSEREAIVASAAGHAFIGPDNGLFALALGELGGAVVARRIERAGRLGEVLPERPSATFHGRDVFAPVAAAIASGRVSLDEVGRELARVHPLALPRPERSPDDVRGEVTHFDRFGNAVTNVRADDLPAPCDALAAELADGRRVRVVATYAAARPGELVAVVGSEGLLELATRDGSAREAAPLALGARVRFARAAAGS